MDGVYLRTGEDAVRAVLARLAADELHYADALSAPVPAFDEAQRAYIRTLAVRTAAACGRPVEEARANFATPGDFSRIQHIIRRYDEGPREALATARNTIKECSRFVLTYRTRHSSRSPRTSSSITRTASTRRCTYGRLRLRLATVTFIDPLCTLYGHAKRLSESVNRFIPVDAIIGSAFTALDTRGHAGRGPRAERARGAERHL